MRNVDLKMKPSYSNEVIKNNQGSYKANRIFFQLDCYNIFLENRVVQKTQK